MHFDHGPFHHNLVLVDVTRRKPRRPSSLSALGDRPGKEKLPDAESILGAC